MPGGVQPSAQQWEPEDDFLILQLHEQIGPKWKSIVKRFPGRTVSSVRNRFQRIERGRKLRLSGAELKNRCHACGEPKRGHICHARLSGGPMVEIAADALPIAEKVKEVDPGAATIPIAKAMIIEDAPSQTAAGTAQPALPALPITTPSTTPLGGFTGGEPVVARSNTSFFLDAVTSSLSGTLAPSAAPAEPVIQTSPTALSGFTGGEPVVARSSTSFFLETLADGLTRQAKEQPEQPKEPGVYGSQAEPDLQRSNASFFEHASLMLQKSKPSIGSFSFPAVSAQKSDTFGVSEAVLPYLGRSASSFALDLITTAAGL